MGHGPGLRIGRPPDLFTGLLVQSYRQGSAAGRDDQMVAIEKRALSVVPGRNLGSVFLYQILAPHFLAGRGIQCMENRLGIQCEHELAIDGRHCTRNSVIGSDASRLPKPPQLGAFLQ